MSSFLTNHGVLVALVCAVAAIVYGVLTTRTLLALPAGNEKMQAISKAVQEGASAYLRVSTRRSPASAWSSSSP